MAPKTMGATALRQISASLDVSMSLDNVLAVAGAARDNLPMLIIGLAISILMMGVAATLISRLLERFPVVAYIGVALIVWIGVEDGLRGRTHLYARFTGERHHDGRRAPDRSGRRADARRRPAGAGEVAQAAERAAGVRTFGGGRSPASSAASPGRPRVGRPPRPRRWRALAGGGGRLPPGAARPSGGAGRGGRCPTRTAAF
jgi:hypothetical protein